MPPPTTLAQLTDFAARAHGDLDALADGEVRWDFGQLDEAVRAAARAVIALGVEPGDRVALWASNSRAWITAALGALSAGGVLVPLNTRYKAAEAADIIRRSGARTLLTERGFLGIDYVAMLRDSGEDLGALETVVVLRGGATGPALGWDDCLARGRQVSEAHRSARAAAVAPDDLADILYTSGTTGLPKGVMSTHRQVLAGIGAWSRAVTLRPGDRYLLLNPFFHTFGYKAGFVACLLRGAAMVPEAVYDVDRVLRRIAEEHISVLLAPPTVFHGLVRHPRLAGHDLGALRLAGTGASVVPVELVDEIRERLGVPGVFTAYGLTECMGVVAVCPVDADAWSVSHTVGLPLPGTEIRIVGPGGPAGDALPPGRAGEIAVRGPQVMRGYLDDPGATARVIDGDGWLYTGDIGVLDARGYLSITDRLKDMYVVGGFNAYPAEVENVLRCHPLITEAAVVGAPDERLGEVGVAYLVTEGGQRPDPAELTAWTRERLANFKVPRRFHVVPELPRNASGKILKARLRRAEERARQEEANPQEADPEGESR
ncbi:FadD3 family acyl-CoA ligase [Streptomyces sp. NPDC059398]|uniref:FadD3 family acyl-CoA ligase n=1 Tax=Streptomyces sp. NPDC059398 TaxID=3346820 RepID=UPI0036846B9D